MKIIVLITAIVLAATMTVTAVLRPPAVVVEPLAPVVETAEHGQLSPAPATKEENIEEPIPEEIPVAMSEPKKDNSIEKGKETAQLQSV